MRTLIIVESLAKARTLGNFLSKDYTVKTSVGHIRDLPPHEMGVDPDREGEAIAWHIQQGRVFDECHFLWNAPVFPVVLDPWDQKLTFPTISRHQLRFSRPSGGRGALYPQYA
jgi:hypothetical protein